VGANPGRGGGLPGCGAETARVHEYRERMAANVPVGGRRVLVRVRVRRIRCPVPDGQVQTFRSRSQASWTVASGASPD
jgi:transposase